MALAKRFFVPSKGKRVVDPVSGNPLPDGGALVQITGGAGVHWTRRLRDGDVTEIDPPPALAAAQVVVDQVVDQVDDLAPPAALEEPTNPPSPKKQTKSRGKE